MRPVRFFLVAFCIVLCDQLSKWAIASRMVLHESRPVVDHVLSLTYTTNTGGAFSLFPARNEVFLLVAGLAIIALVVAYLRHHQTDLVISAALGLALGGAIGNLIDRARFGYVIDFFDVHIWPVFNIADAAISVGILLLVVQVLRSAICPTQEANPARGTQDGAANLAHDERTGT